MSLPEAATRIWPVLVTVTKRLRYDYRDMLTQQQLIERVNEVLRSRNLTVNGASTLHPLDRQALTKMTKGKRPSLPFLEKFAETFRLDVNEWREMYGYPAVTPSDYVLGQRALRWILGTQAITRQYPGAEVTGDEIDLVDPTSEESIDACLAALRDRLARTGRCCQPR